MKKAPIWLSKFTRHPQEASEEISILSMIFMSIFLVTKFSSRFLPYNCANSQFLVTNEKFLFITFFNAVWVKFAQFLFNNDIHWEKKRVIEELVIYLKRRNNNFNF